MSEFPGPALVTPVEEVGIGAAAALDAVIARTAMEGVGIAGVAVAVVANLDQIVAIAAINGVVGGAAKSDRVVAGAAIDRAVGAITQGDRVVSVTAVDGIVVTANRDGVVALATMDRGVVYPGDDRVVASPAVCKSRIRPQGNRIRAFRSDHRPIGKIVRRQHRAIGKLELFNPVVSVIPMLNGYLVGCRRIVRVIDFDHQVVAGAADRDVIHCNSRPKHDSVLARQVTAVVVDGVLTVAPVEKIGIGTAAALDTVVALAASRAGPGNSDMVLEHFSFRHLRIARSIVILRGAKRSRRIKTPHGFRDFARNDVITDCS